MKNNNYLVTVNNGVKDFEFSENELDQLDIVADGEGHFHILKNNQSFRAEIVECDFKNKTFTIKINGTTHHISIADHFDQLVKELGFTITNTQKLKDIKAPMPGLVLEIVVAPGEEIQEGDALIILEAMKMENVLKATGEGIVKTIAVKKGDAVDKAQLLIEME